MSGQVAALDPENSVSMIVVGVVVGSIVCCSLIFCWSAAAFVWAFYAKDVDERRQSSERQSKNAENSVQEVEPSSVESLHKTKSALEQELREVTSVT